MLFSTIPCGFLKGNPLPVPFSTPGRLFLPMCLKFVRLRVLKDVSTPGCICPVLGTDGTAGTDRYLEASMIRASFAF